jgi:integrase
VLAAKEFCSLLEALPQRERALGAICATTGLRIDEALGLKWEDINFNSRIADVLRSYSDGAIGPCRRMRPLPTNRMPGIHFTATRRLTIGSSPATSVSGRPPCGRTASGRRSCSL